MLDGRTLNAYRVIEAPGMQEDLVRWGFLKLLDKPVEDLATELLPIKKASMPAKKIWRALGGIIVLGENGGDRDSADQKIVAADKLATEVYGMDGNFEMAALYTQIYRLRLSVRDPDILYTAVKVGYGFIENLSLNSTELRLLYVLNRVRGEYLSKTYIRDELNIDYSVLNWVISHFGRIKRPRLERTTGVVLETRNGSGRYSPGVRLVEI